MFFKQQVGKIDNLPAVTDAKICALRRCRYRALVWHVDDKAPTDEEEYEKLIGVYSSKRAARDAIERLRDKPGFRDYPERWKIDDWDLDRDEWVEGFVTVRNGAIQ